MVKNNWGFDAKSSPAKSEENKCLNPNWAEGQVSKFKSRMHIASEHGRVPKGNYVTKTRIIPSSQGEKVKSQPSFLRARDTMPILSFDPHNSASKSIGCRKFAFGQTGKCCDDAFSECMKWRGLEALFSEYASNNQLDCPKLRVRGRQKFRIIALLILR